MQAGRQAVMQVGRQEGRQECRHAAGRQTGRQAAGRWAGRQADCRACGQAGRQAFGPKKAGRSHEHSGAGRETNILIILITRQARGEKDKCPKHADR
jgi:hypothetical protein